MLMWVSHIRIFAVQGADGGSIGIVEITSDSVVGSERSLISNSKTLGELLCLDGKVAICQIQWIGLDDEKLHRNLKFGGR